MTTLSQSPALRYLLTLSSRPASTRPVLDPTDNATDSTLAMNWIDPPPMFAPKCNMRWYFGIARLLVGVDEIRWLCVIVQYTGHVSPTQQLAGRTNLSHKLQHRRTHSHTHTQTANSQPTRRPHTRIQWGGNEFAR
eukprot:m.1287924 g.1287924  ORF g.1287924 m.1287924 type:complete len:136 (-) comp24781_c0_seq39:2179-2586(-)